MRLTKLLNSSCDIFDVVDKYEFHWRHINVVPTTSYFKFPRASGNHVIAINSSQQATIGNHLFNFVAGDKLVYDDGVWNIECVGPMDIAKPYPDGLPMTPQKGDIFCMPEDGFSLTRYPNSQPQHLMTVRKDDKLVFDGQHWTRYATVPMPKPYDQLKPVINANVSSTPVPQHNQSGYNFDQLFDFCVYALKCFVHVNRKKYKFALSKSAIQEATYNGQKSC